MMKATTLPIHERKEIVIDHLNIAWLEKVSEAGGVRITFTGGASVEVCGGMAFWAHHIRLARAGAHVDAEGVLREGLEPI